MSITVEQVMTEALALTPHARAFVAERLIESLDLSYSNELSSAWRDEIRKRCNEMDNGAVELLDANDVFQRAYAALS
jgi:putative addiction module component (TIGR02574 family)